jgi:hypothetical protein
MLNGIKIFPIVLLLVVSGAMYAQNKEVEKLPYDKGYVFFGATGGASLRESENEDALFFLIREQDKKGYNVLLTGGYLLTPSVAVGGALQYDRSSVSKITEDTDGIVSNIREAGSIVTTSAYAKYFIPLTPSKRFNLYTIAGLAWVADRNTIENFSQDILTRTYVNKNTVRLGISPGIQVFVVDGFATEVGVNVAGFSGSRKKETVNGVPNASVSTFDLDLRLNILTMNISFYYYFPVNKK